MLSETELKSILENETEINYKLFKEEHVTEKNTINLLKIVYDYLFSKSIGSNVIISLSGGVDSMVLLALLKRLIPFGKITALHINYGNRDQTDLEEKFLDYVCSENNIEFKVKRFEDYTRGSVNRNEYEEYTKKERFKFYKDNLTKDSIGIFMAHHKNDEQENIFSNLLKGHSLIDLTALKDETIINNVCLLRPFVNITKDMIYDFAHKHSVPYFKDTTPDWSNRGKLRRKVFPVLKEIYNLEDNLDKIGLESIELNQLIVQKIIKKYISESVKEENGVITFNNIVEYHDMPSTFWSYILTNIFHSKNINMISKKSLNQFTQKINKRFEGKINLRKDMVCEMTKNNLKITI
jgi:tRNA(Ile)-lysidine synthetase-like protein